jgi:hypothetical protein
MKRKKCEFSLYYCHFFTHAGEFMILLNHEFVARYSR